MIFRNSWDKILYDEVRKDYYQQLRKFLYKEYETETVFPKKEDVFSALRLTPYEDVKCVILGQDPYHEEGQAHGLAFSVKLGVKQPPSLVNIFKELRDDLGFETPPKNYGCLTHWAEQGVLLLNTCLTVREHRANSHKGKGWEIFTDEVIKALNERKDPIAFILWGVNAKSKAQFITGRQHLILTGAHPSPLSAYNGFFGGSYFSKVNSFMEHTGRTPIDWKISL